MTRAPVALGTAQGRSRALNPSRLVNLYPEVPPPGSRAELIHVGTPGQKAWATVGTGTIRAAREAFGYLYALSGTSLYRVDSNGNATLCTGDAMAATGIAMMSYNGVQLTVQSDTEAFVVTGTTVTKITDPDFPGCSSHDYIDGYTVFTRPDSGQWFISDLFNSASFDALDFATAESNPDNLMRVLVDHREVWLFGPDSIEPWTNTGASPFPFERVNGALIEKGLGAALSPVKQDNSLFWLGSDKVIYRAEGYQPRRISTHPIEEILRSASTVADAYGMSYSQAGHAFYALTLPSAGRTLVYDAALPDASAAWHERQSGTALTPAAWNPQCMFKAFDKTMVGLAGGVIAELDLDTFADLGAPIRSSVSCPPIYADGDQAIMDRVELECELGVGRTTGQGSAPVAMLRVSDDGGNTWKAERTAPLGPIGSRRKRAIWTGEGAFRERTMEFAISDPVKRTIYGMKYWARGLAA